MSNEAPAYSYTLDDLLPQGSDELHYYPEDLGIGERRIIRFQTASRSWHGVFFDQGIGGIDGVHPWLHPRAAAVFLSGRGYLIDVENPPVHEILRPLSVHQLFRVDETNEVLLADYCSLTSTLSMDWPGRHRD